MLYNYNGDNMNSGDIIVNVKSIKDIENINQNTKYINLAIDDVNTEVIDYFLLNGSEYSYSDSITGRNGFIYSSYDMFKYGESIIANITINMPNNLSELEKVRYIYISLGKILSSDINLMNDKNEIISFNRISIINNIWGAISKCKVNDVIISKIFMYVCSRVGIKSELVSSSIKGNIVNKVYIDDSYLILDLYSDIYNIQGGFSTEYFDKYNDDKDIDKKIGYIKEEYMNYYIDMMFKDFDYKGEDMLYQMLININSVININNIGTYELYKICEDVFHKYAKNIDVKINNLYVYNGLDVKDHFVVFSNGDSYYSFNYNKGMFISVDKNILSDNIKCNKIGVYDDEEFVIREKGVVL